MAETQQQQQQPQQQDREPRLSWSANTTNGAHATGRSQTSSPNVHNRLLHRQSSPRVYSPSLQPELLRRRSSILSFSSLEDATQSFTEDILHPSGRMSHGKEIIQEEVDHWHSSPLAFAILPAVGGLLFTNGSAFVTDVLLLGLAAVFMNWSIRLPWDWYYSAQATRRNTEPDFETALDEDDPTLVSDEVAVATPASDASPKMEAEQKLPAEQQPSLQDTRRRAEATADLRRQEILALLSTFIFPALAAYLLHVIRAQLSRPSTSLVSDYNLSIFLLAAEIRPVRQLVRLISTRTLHLQRVANGALDSSPYSGAQLTPALNDLGARLTTLESKLSTQDQLPEPTSLAQKTDVSELSAEMRKRYEPRLEGLERAVRRYEKRSTTLAMLTEQRLQSLEQRLQDALSLAAVAAQSSQRRGLVGSTMDGLAVMLAWPFKAGLTLAVLPFQLVDEAYSRLKGLLLGPSPSRRDKRRKQDEKLQRERPVSKKAAR